MEIADVIIKVNRDHTVGEINWFNDNLEKLYGQIWERHRGEKLTNLFPNITVEEDHDELIWENNYFTYCIVDVSISERLLMMKQSNNKEYLLSRALDHVREGVQIYDSNACAVYFNQNSRKISEIPDDVNLEGRHLLDMYPLDEEISTTLTSLRTKQPVFNRVDHYNSTDGTFIATANTAYPIARKGEIVGTVVFEQNKEVVQDYIKRMSEIDEALDSYDKTDSYLHFTGYTFSNILGKGKAMRETVSIAQKIAPQECSVLLVGETGTGKELFAQSIHKESLRRNEKFLAINCAAIPATLIESLLFGTAKGSFTGSEDKAGYFEEANGGTLFLDELNSMSLSMQSKILRVLQEKTFRRVGGEKDISTDVRIISSCNENPFVALEENRLRKDLFYRISTVIINLPPLREHTEDLNTLIQARINNSNLHFVNKVSHVSPDVMSFLKSYAWPGNVRELFHVIDYALNITESDTIELKHLPKYLFVNTAGDNTSSHSQSEVAWNNDSLQTVMDNFEEQIIRQALDKYGGNISKTAAVLDIKRQSLQYRIKKYGIII